MDRRFKERQEALQADAIIDPAMFQDLLPRVKEFVGPFAACLPEKMQKQRAEDYVGGLLSHLKYKNVEEIAYLFGQDRQGLQKFIGQAPWDHRPLMRELVRQVGVDLGEADGVIVFDPSSFPKKGTESVGVARQWCGRLGKVENCQVGVYMGYVSRREHALVDFRLYLNQAWAKDKKKRKKCGVPKKVGFQTRHALALEMLDENGSLLPHGWITGDDELGRPAAFRRELRDRNECYLLAVPSNTLVRHLDAEPPPYSGHGRRPKVPMVTAERLVAALPESAWTTLEVRAGEKGPLMVAVVKLRVAAKLGRRTGPQEVLVAFRERQADGSYKHDYALSNAEWQMPLATFAWVMKAEHRIEECLQRAKGNTGLADYEVRNWPGWHHHQTLSLIAAWFLNQETRRGKKMDPGDHGSAAELVHRRPAPEGLGLRRAVAHLRDQHPPIAAPRASSVLLLEKPEPLAPIAG